MKRLILRTWLFCLLIVLGLTNNPAAAHADDGLPRVEPSDCLIEVPEDTAVECGILIVPENYAKPDGNQIRLPYIIIHSPSKNADATSLLFTEGGPGGTSLQSVWGFKNSVMLQDRDIIIFEQRGNHFADPAMGCTMEEIFAEQLGNSPCLEKLTTAGIDLSQYTTAVLAEDIESLRVALDIDQWNLFSSSYSTRLVQVLIDRYPEGIRSAILQSVNPLHDTRYNHDPEHSYRALSVMFEDCAADSECSAAYPDLADRFFALVAELNQNPIQLTLENPNDGTPYAYEVSGETLITWMVGGAFYGPAFPPFTTAYYPLLIDRLSKGQMEVLNSWAENEISNNLFTPGFIAFGLYLTVNCQDDTAGVTEEALKNQAAAFPQMDGYLRFWDEWQICQLWGLPPAPPLAERPISSDLPTLMLAGRYDPVTPPEWAKAVAGNLPNSFYIEFPSMGHSLDRGSTCAEEIKRSFLQNPIAEPEITCLAEMPETQFVLSNEGIYMPGYLASVEDINIGVPDQGEPVLEGITIISMLIFLMEIIYLIVLVVRVVGAGAGRRSKIKSTNLIFHIIAGISAVLSVATVMVSSSVLQEITNMAEWEFVLVGMPVSTPQVPLLGGLVVVQVFCAVILLFSGVLLWFSKRGSIVNRMVFTLVALGVTAFSYFLVRWDLLNIAFSKLGLLS